MSTVAQRPGETARNHDPLAQERYDREVEQLHADVRHARQNIAEATEAGIWSVQQARSLNICLDNYQEGVVRMLRHVYEISGDESS